MELKRKIAAVRGTLDKIEVTGYGNLDRMLGCMQALDEVLARMREEEDAEDHAE